MNLTMTTTTQQDTFINLRFNLVPATGGSVI